MQESVEDIESDYEGTAFEGISSVMSTHPDVVDFICNETDRKPDNFISIIEDISSEDQTELEEKSIKNTDVHIVDVLQYILDLLSFFETSIHNKMQSSELTGWELYKNEIDSKRDLVVDQDIEELQSDFESPLVFLHIKSKTAMKLLEFLSYQGNEPTLGDYFIYSTEDDSYIYGRITEKIVPENQIIDGCYYRYDILAYGSEVSDHKLINKSDELLRPIHSNSLEFFNTEQFFK